MSKIMIVDDSRTSRKILRSLLEEEGYEVIGEAADGKEAIKLYDQLKPDLVTMDITMPEMDGVEAVKEIKRLYPSAKVIMITAAGQKGKIIEALKLGVDDFLTKPYEREYVLETIHKVLG